MLAAHFPRTYGEKVDHQHTGIISVVRIGLDGKMRPNAPPRPKLEDQTDGLVARADSGDVEPSQMKIGLIVGELCDSEELDRFFGGPQPLQPIEFEEGDGTVTRMEADGAVTVVTPAEQEPAAPAASEQERAPARRSDSPVSRSSAPAQASKGG
jgi:hypothetical protein